MCEITTRALCEITMREQIWHASSLTRALFGRKSEIWPRAQGGTKMDKPPTTTKAMHEIYVSVIRLYSKGSLSLQLLISIPVLRMNTGTMCVYARKQLQ